MTEIVTLLTGILVAAWIFAAAFFSAAQVFRQTGALRWAHLLAMALTIASMACLSAGLWDLARVAGALTALAGLAALLLERRWNRILPLVQAAFGTVVLMGLPFGG